MSEPLKTHGCHSERSEESNSFNKLEDRPEGSILRIEILRLTPQNDIMTQRLGEGNGEGESNGSGRSGCEATRQNIFTM